jgi:hypothetical protein
VGDGNFELKPALINMVQENPFPGKTNEDANYNTPCFCSVLNCAHDPLNHPYKSP